MSKRKKIVIVGGVAGGASAAARARRLSEDADIIIFERGQEVSFANCGLPYHIGGAIVEREKLLVQTPEKLDAMLRIDARVRHEVLSIDRENQTVLVRKVDTGEESHQPYDNLVLSPGAAPIRPTIPGAESDRVLTLRNMADMDEIDCRLADTATKRAVIVGGGYIGLEMAEALCNRGLCVTLVELTDQVMGPADPEMIAPLYQELSLHGVDLRLKTSVTSFNESSDALDVILDTGETIDCQLAILAIGVRPEVKLAQNAGLQIGRLGGISVDANMRTSDPKIFAVGDAVEVKNFVDDSESLIPLAGPANRQGRIAADNIFGRPTAYEKTLGTSICKVFNLAMGMTGLSEKALRRAEAEYEKIHVHPQSHAGYYPGASPVSLKLLFHPTDGRILGAQAVGVDGVDKRIDVLATAIRAGMTVFDLENLELAYAPPYGSAKDVVNYAGFAAANAIRGDVGLCHVDNVQNMNENQALLDVRFDKEVAGGTIPGSKQIPLPKLRNRLDELSKERQWLVFCQAGLRGYLACRILTQNGFDCRNLSGGYKTYMMSTMDAAKQNEDARKIKGSCEHDVAKVIKSVDACGLQCPGPIQKLKAEIDTIQPGEAISIMATDPGFLTDIPAWCNTTGNKLVEISPDGKAYRATIVKQPQTSDIAEPDSKSPTPKKKGLTIVVFSDDFDRAFAAFIIANGAAAMGYNVTLFFTFWGLNVLRKDSTVEVEKTFVEKMFGWMMPRGPEKLALSKMHMCGMGLAMIKDIMKNKNVTSLPESIKSAQSSRVKLVACTMTMDLMGIKREELIDGVDEGGVALYLDKAGQGNINLFI